jgi:predicted ATPase/DNA-binding SARP family transcriptional activator
MSGDGMLEVRLLGQFEVLRDGKRVTIPTRNAQSLFAYLILNAGRDQRRERLAGLLWPDSSEENARSNLRHELWRLRKAIETKGDFYFLVDDLTIAFNPQGEYLLDVHKLESASLEDSTADELIEALSAYRGELLPGFYDEWVFVERDRLSAVFEVKIARLLEILQAEGRWEEVLDWGLRWIALGGWPEPAYRALMTAYANTGDISKAVATYDRYTQALQKELGMKPSEQMQALYKQLKTGWKTDAPKPPADKPAQAPPLPKVRRSNLPRPLTSFIGREKEIQQVVGLVSRARLVTITGAGGVGKTRLAIQAAEVLAPQFRDSAWWVELASISGIIPPKRESPGPPMKQEISSGADLIHQAIAKVLCVAEMPGIPILEALLEHLHDKQLLLVLDNCEHLIEACAALVERLLGHCPEVTILATSREALGVPGEKAWLLPSLSLPSGEPSLGLKDIFRSEAVSLFIERATDVVPGYQPGELDAPTIAQICLRLDGIPLAIELAAARMNLLSAQEIATRLDQRFSLLTGGRRTALPRHQTLWAAIEWSHELLNRAERILFRRLSVFAGSFTLEAVEDVCTGKEIRRDEILSLLGRLVDKSLLIVEPTPRDLDLATRYRFLDTIRSFGQMKLDEAGETRQMRDRHAEYYVRLVEAAEPKFYLHDQVHWYRLLQAENDNIRDVVEWSAESDQAESALRLAGALRRFWFFFRLSPRRA